MKKFSVLLSIVALAIVFAGCEGPPGPTGDAGADGTNGTNGTDGIDGIDGIDANETCKVCHNSDEVLISRRLQYSISTHATGGHAAYGNREYNATGYNCARCHTSQGFVELVTNQTITAPYGVPNQQNCRTCHDLHNTYTATDWARRVTTPPVSIQANDETTLLGDFGGGNLCATCHQARYADIPALSATADVIITSKRYGPHHGPQANFVDGSAGYQYAGGTAYPAVANPHLAGDSCVDCHMTETGNYLYGGHTWKMYVDPHDEDADGDKGSFNDKACVAVCHVGIDMEAKMATTKTEFDGLLATLKGLLEAGGYIDASGYAANGGVGIGASNTLTVAPKIAGAIYNYRMIAIEDAGYVVHNPRLVRALLNNSIQAMQ